MLKSEQIPLSDAGKIPNAYLLTDLPTYTSLR